MFSWPLHETTDTQLAACALPFDPPSFFPRSRLHPPRRLPHSLSYGTNVQWLVIVVIALLLSGANIYGYTKCNADAKNKASRRPPTTAPSPPLAIFFLWMSYSFCNCTA